MIYWLLVAILAYFCFGFSSFGDKLFLAGKPKPNSYTFYVGIFGLFVVLFIPFAGFSTPNASQFIWIILDAIVYTLGLYTMYVAIERFDVSRVVATIGAIQPLLIFLLTWIFWGPQIMSSTGLIAFVLLFLGSIIISVEKTIKLTKSYLFFTVIASSMFSLDYIFSKSLFITFPFIHGLIWIRLFVFLFVLVFLLTKKSRREIFSKEIVSSKKNQELFLFAQIAGGAGNVLQSFAISLAPIALLATVNSLKGIQYVFLFVITLISGIFLPKFFKEGLSKRTIIQKVLSIIIIFLGLAVLAIS